MNVTFLSPLAFALSAASMLVATSAQAQSAACEEFKNKLAAKVDPSITAFTLDIVRSNAPVPPGAKVFGTCDGGAYKLLFQRGGSTRPSAAASVASASVPAAPAPQAVAKPSAAPAPVASAPSAAPKLSVVASAPQQPPRPPVQPASAAVAATPAPPPVKPVSAAASPATVARALTPAPAPPVAASPAEEAVVKAEPDPGSKGPGFLVQNLGWICALFLLPLFGGLWAWRAHRNAYDDAGLPRGPKL